MSKEEFEHGTRDSNYVIDTSYTIEHSLGLHIAHFQWLLFHVHVLLVDWVGFWCKMFLPTMGWALLVTWFQNPHMQTIMFYLWHYANSIIMNIGTNKINRDKTFPSRTSCNKLCYKPTYIKLKKQIKIYKVWNMFQPTWLVDQGQVGHPPNMLHHTNNLEIQASHHST